MWLKLDLLGMILRLKISHYVKTTCENWDEEWCGMECSFVFGSALNFSSCGSSMCSGEIDVLKEMLKRLLADELTEPRTFECIEPDFVFILNPKGDLQSNPGDFYDDIHLEWKVYFWDGGVTNHYFSASLVRSDIMHLLTYLQVVTGELSKKDSQVRELIADGIFYEDVRNSCGSELTGY